MKRIFVSLSVVFIVLVFIISAAYAENPITMLVNGQVITTDVPLQISQGRIMVPARSVAEALGADVTWDSDTKTVRINSREDDSIPPVSKPPAPVPSQSPQSPKPPVTEFGKVTVVSLGFAAGEHNDLHGFYPATGAVTVFNSDIIRAAKNVQVTLNIYDSSHTVIQTEKITIPYIPPNTEAYAATDLFVRGNIAPESASPVDYVKVTEWQKEIVRSEDDD